MVAMRSQRKPIEVAEPSLRVRLVGFDATCLKTTSYEKAHLFWRGYLHRCEPIC
jgi:hypothetical protein